MAVAIAVALGVLVVAVVGVRQFLSDFDSFLRTRYMLDDLAFVVIEQFERDPDATPKSVWEAIENRTTTGWPPSCYNADEKDVRDYWGRSVRIEWTVSVDGAVTVLTTSAGADGRFGTGDDIRPTAQVYHRGQM